MPQVLNFAVPDQLLVDRITGRWVHPASGRSYHGGWPVLLLGRCRVGGSAGGWRAQLTAVPRSCRQPAVPARSLLPPCCSSEPRASPSCVSAEKFAPPKVAGVDDVTGEPLVKRKVRLWQGWLVLWFLTPHRCCSEGPSCTTV